MEEETVYDQLSDIIRMLGTVIRGVADNKSLCRKVLTNGQTMFDELMQLRIHFHEGLGNLITFNDPTETYSEETTTMTSIADFTTDKTNNSSDKGFFIVVVLLMLQCGLVVSKINCRCFLFSKGFILFAAIFWRG